MSIFSRVEMAPHDPILGLNEKFNADQRVHKVNLGVGVYYDGSGKLALLDCVRQAEQNLAHTPKARGYLPIDGIVQYRQLTQNLVFGDNNEAVQDGRVATTQTLGGTGALKTGADFLKNILPEAIVLLSNPSWENHRAIFSAAGFKVESYPYYDAARKGIDVQGMIDKLSNATPGTVVLLHACCHNPTGYDLTAEEWDSIIDVIAHHDLVPFVDMAYQGFGEGLEQDNLVVQKLVKAGKRFFIASSFSKNFGLYGERVGALSVVCENPEETARVLSQLKATIRTTYSNPPTHGASIVAMVLSTPTLRTQWMQELTDMRERIQSMRKELVLNLQTLGLKEDMSFIARQAGMFSYSGLTKEQMTRLREDFGIYGTDSGRLCIAALNVNNLGYVCESIAQVLQPQIA